MKHLKKYNESATEFNINNSIYPKKGDYVIMNTKSNRIKIRDFITNNIGIIKSIDNTEYPHTEIVVIYENIPDDVKMELLSENEYSVFRKNTYERDFIIKLIKYFSPNKQDLIQILTTQKYNL